MSDNKTVKYYKKRSDQKVVVQFSHQDLQSIRRWLITGSFKNSFFLNDLFDRSKIGLLKKVINHNPEKIVDLMEEALPIKLNDSTFIYTLVLLSNSNFRAKKIFKDNFNKCVVSPKELYHFMELCKKERGFGKAIHDTIKKWFRSHDIHDLERMFVEHRSGFNWKSQDVMRMIKPKPCDKKEQLLFRWLAKDSIQDSELHDYERDFPLIYNYELMRHNIISQQNMGYVRTCIRDYGFKNNMIPANVQRSPEIYDEFYNVESKGSLPITDLPKHVHKLGYKVIKDIDSAMKDKISKLTILSLLTLYTQLKGVANSANEVSMIDTIETELLVKIKSRSRLDSIHVIDTNVNMLSEVIRNINVTPAVATSVLVGSSKNIVDFDGNSLGRREPRAILEAEGFIRTYNKPNYNKIFTSIKDMKSDTVFVWTNDKSFNREMFYSRFRRWKQENGKVMRLVVINLTDKKSSSDFDFKEVYGLNKKTEKLIEYLKDGII